VGECSPLVLNRQVDESAKEMQLIRYCASCSMLALSILSITIFIDSRKDANICYRLK
jgi:hypothetical protein